MQAFVTQMSKGRLGHSGNPWDGRLVHTRADQARWEVAFPSCLLHQVDGGQSTARIMVRGNPLQPDNRSILKGDSSWISRGILGITFPGSRGESNIEPRRLTDVPLGGALRGFVFVVEGDARANPTQNHCALVGRGGLMED